MLSECAVWHIHSGYFKFSKNRTVKQVQQNGYLRFKIFVFTFFDLFYRAGKKAYRHSGYINFHGIIISVKWDFFGFKTAFQWLCQATVFYIIRTKNSLIASFKRNTYAVISSGNRHKIAYDN